MSVHCRNFAILRKSVAIEVIKIGLEKLTGIQITNDVKDNRYIVLSQTDDYMRNCVVLKVFDIKEQVIFNISLYCICCFFD
ncbi:hypothetical protein [Clostridium butyricum]|uniref:hypothetical protein n=1 Tax=Clostridium butyricum TaxID=1492 RepID=UPI002ABD8619|nr:hypothetical protein [Clostridium butyricum]